MLDRRIRRGIVQLRLGGSCCHSHHGSRYPSDGLVRTYLLERQDPPERFVELVRFRKAEVESQLAAGVAANAGGVAACASAAEQTNAAPNATAEQAV